MPLLPRRPIFSAEARALLGGVDGKGGLLCSAPAERLGYMVLSPLPSHPSLCTISGGAKDVMGAAWFSGFEWGALGRLEMTPPWRPNPSHTGDTSYFDGGEEEDDDSFSRGGGGADCEAYQHVWDRFGPQEALPMSALRMDAAPPPAPADAGTEQDGAAAAGDAPGYRTPEEASPRPLDADALDAWRGLPAASSSEEGMPLGVGAAADTALLGCFAVGSSIVAARAFNGAPDSAVEFDGRIARRVQLAKGSSPDRGSGRSLSPLRTGPPTSPMRISATGRSSPDAQPTAGTTAKGRGRGRLYTNAAPLSGQFAGGDNSPRVVQRSAAAGFKSSTPPWTPGFYGRNGSYSM
jgi:hypothetical protein